MAGEQREYPKRLPQPRVVLVVVARQFGIAPYISSFQPKLFALPVRDAELSRRRQRERRALRETLGYSRLLACHCTAAACLQPK